MIYVNFFEGASPIQEKEARYLHQWTLDGPDRELPFRMPRVGEYILLQGSILYEVKAILWVAAWKISVFVEEIIEKEITHGS